ncbi:MAG: VIT family protein [Pseudomonadota bacterium]|nr:VIT family protein [Pseudomonadota bacterium]
MTVVSPHPEHHLSHRTNWLRAAVLGANDGIVSTASLLVGVAAASSGKPEILVAGVATLFAGAMSMAAGEYVSVSSQADTERADIEIEKRALKKYPKEELAELAAIYVQRGLDPDLAGKVAAQLSAHDSLEAHKRDELGITELAQARPLQAAGASALSFSIGSALPLAAAALSPLSGMHIAVPAASLLSLALLGAVSAKTGGAKMPRAVMRVVFWGAAAMAVTAAVGALFGAAV